MLTIFINFDSLTYRPFIAESFTEYATNLLLIGDTLRAFRFAKAGFQAYTDQLKVTEIDRDIFFNSYNKFCRVLIATGNIPKAIKWFANILDTLNADDSSNMLNPSVISIKIAQASLILSTSQPEEGYRILSPLYEAIKNMPYLERQAADVAFNLARYYRQVGDYNTLRKYSDSAVKKYLNLTNFKNPEINCLIGSLYKDEAASYYYQGDLTRARQTLEKALYYFLICQSQGLDPSINIRQAERLKKAIKDKTLIK